MADLWLPGVEHVAGCKHTGGSLVGGPPRMVHHITWDALDAQGNPPAFDNVKNYLARVGFEPHLMVDPFTGRIVQFLPFNTSGYAVDHKGSPETNRFGTACIQVEWYFSPNVLRDGKRYPTLADTPMFGLERVLAVADSYGIPRVWPMGTPTWTANRNATVWTTRAGHYGHGQVPNNTHTDPGPVPSLAAPARVPASVPAPTPVQEDEDMAVIIQSDTAGTSTYVEDGDLIYPVDGPTFQGWVDAGAKVVKVSAGTLPLYEAKWQQIKKELGL